jgi:hypothetical protein
MGGAMSSGCGFHEEIGSIAAQLEQMIARPRLSHAGLGRCHLPTRTPPKVASITLVAGALL